MTSSAAQTHDQPHDHVIPLPIYFGVYGALLVLTVITVGVSYADLGPASIYVAMFVAIIKAALVVGYFMHLKYDSRFNALVFIVSLLFLMLFFSFTMIDIASRDAISKTEGNFTLIEDKAAKAAAEAKAAGSSTPPAAASSAPTVQ